MMQAEKNILYFAKVRPGAKLPERKTSNAGYDVYAEFPEQEMIIRPHNTVLVPTGIASAMSPDWYLQVEERSSTGSKGIKKSCGVIDSSYRGEIYIVLTNASDCYVVIAKDPAAWENQREDYIVHPYEKAIAQLILHRVHNEVSVMEITMEELQAIPSDRGNGAFGSTGK